MPSAKSGPKIPPNGSSENYRKVSNGYIIEHVLVGQNRGSTDRNPNPLRVFVGFLIGLK